MKGSLYDVEVLVQMGRQSNSETKIAVEVAYLQVGRGAAAAQLLHAHAATRHLQAAPPFTLLPSRRSLLARALPSPSTRSRAPAPFAGGVYAFPGNQETGQGHQQRDGRLAQA